MSTKAILTFPTTVIGSWIVVVDFLKKPDVWMYGDKTFLNIAIDEEPFVALLKTSKKELWSRGIVIKNIAGPDKKLRKGSFYIIAPSFTDKGAALFGDKAIHLLLFNSGKGKIFLIGSTDKKLNEEKFNRLIHAIKEETDLFKTIFIGITQ